MHIEEIRMYLGPENKHYKTVEEAQRAFYRKELIDALELKKYCDAEELARSLEENSVYIRDLLNKIERDTK